MNENETKKKTAFKLKSEYSANSRSIVQFYENNNPTFRTYEWIGRNYQQSIWRFKLERFFDNTAEEIKTLISTIDKQKGLSSKSNYKVRDLELIVNIDEEFKNLG